MTSDAAPLLAPMIFLVEQPAGLVLPGHFHRSNHFQVFAAGAGKIGPKTLEPIIIHCAGAYTAYGRLAAGPDGLKYLMIRPALERGVQMVAETPAVEWPKGPRVHATGNSIHGAGTALHLWESAFFWAGESTAAIIAGPAGAQAAILSVPGQDARKAACGARAQRSYRTPATARTKAIA